MSGSRTTNSLLAVIAACLVAICAQQLLPALLPAAQAQTPSSRVQVLGCFLQYGECKPLTIKVDKDGYLLTRPA